MKKKSAKRDVAKNLRKFTSELVAKRYAKPKMGAHDFAQEGEPLEEAPITSPITGEGPEALENLATWRDPTVRDVAGGLENTLRAAYAQEAEANKIAGQYGNDISTMLSQRLDQNPALQSLQKGGQIKPGTAAGVMNQVQPPMAEDDLEMQSKRMRFAKARLGR